MGNLPTPFHVASGSSVVASVKKHLLQPMAYVTFHSAEIAKAVLLDPPSSVGGISTMPPRPHNADPNSMVLRWNGSPSDLSEESIVTDFNIIFSSSPGILQNGNIPEVAAQKRGLSMSESFGQLLKQPRLM